MATLKPITVRVLVLALLLQPLTQAAAQDEASAAADDSSAAADAASESAAAAQSASEQANQSAQQVQQASADSTNKTSDDADKLKKQIAAQSALIAAQTASGKTTDAKLADLQRMLDQQKAIIETQKKQLEDQQSQLKTTTDLLTNMQSQIDQLKQDDGDNLSDEEVGMRERLTKLETQVGKMPEDPSTLLADEDFPGSFRVPGTTASYKLGGHVKVNLVRNFDPLVTQDRFIVGSIPVTASDQTALASETNLSAAQTRFNFDYRQKTGLGTLRAFIEGDFAGSGDTFRLRHAFGQFRDFLGGKTWSAFYDTQAAPERIDFEGINGRVVVRQTQVRYFPKIGKDWQWVISFEDPNPQVTGGEGVSDLPDVVTSVRRDWFGRWHVKSSLLLRKIGAVNNSGVDLNGQPCEPETGTAPGTPDGQGCIAIANPGAANDEFGWGLSISGKVKVPHFNENDNFLFQLNYGPGLGRYLVDLSSVESLGIDGGQDAIIDPATGDISALKAFGGYVGFQHWWNKTMRSTFVYSYVHVDNEDSQLFNAYYQTMRVSGNFIWSPIPNIDLGAEFMWGRRENEGTDPVSGNRGATASQLQLEAVYRF